MKFKFLSSEKGAVNVVLFILILAFTILLAGGLVPPKTPEGTSEKKPSGSYSCCDDENCALKDPQISYNGKTYKKIKSNIALSEQWGHLTNTGELSPDGDPIIINTTESTANHPECGKPGQDDLFFGGPGGSCISNPDDQIIYVCRENCVGVPQRAGAAPQSFGKFDAYFIDDGTPVPNFIKECSKSNNAFGGAAPGQAGGDLIVFPSPTPPSEKTLQLTNFNIVKRPSSASPWLSPYCKPAIYLYPEQKTQVNVKVSSPFNITNTLPKYPNSGWDVLAYPDGELLYQNTFYDYLYYESQIPDEKITEPKDGFVIPYSQIEEKLNEILPKLGLNQNEKSQFIKYWTKVLPISPYYFIGIIPPSELSEFTKLNFTPTPDNQIRVTLYFKSLDQPYSITPPQIKTPNRNGFTIVEWGGIFKKHPGTSFTCLM